MKTSSQSQYCIHVPKINSTAFTTASPVTTTSISAAEPNHSGTRMVNSGRHTTAKM
jgi:hypothetical protein